MGESKRSPGRTRPVTEPPSRPDTENGIRWVASASPSMAAAVSCAAADLPITLVHPLTQQQGPSTMGSCDSSESCHSPWCGPSERSAPSG